MNNSKKKVGMRNFLKNILGNKPENYKRIEVVFKFNSTVIDILKKLKISIETIDLIKNEDDKLNSLGEIKDKIEVLKNSTTKFRLLIPNSFQVITSPDLRDYLYKILEEINFSKLNDFSEISNLNRIELYQKRKDVLNMINSNLEILRNFNNRLEDVLKNVTN